MYENDLIYHFSTQTIPISTNILEASPETVLFPLLLILTLFMQLLTPTKLYYLTLTFILSLHTVHSNCRLLSHCPLLLQLSVTLPSLLLMSLKLCHLLIPLRPWVLTVLGPTFSKSVPMFFTYHSTISFA